MPDRSAQERALALVAARLYARADPSTANLVTSAAEYVQAACLPTRDVQETIEALGTVAAALVECAAFATAESPLAYWRRFTTELTEGHEDRSG